MPLTSASNCGMHSSAKSSRDSHKTVSLSHSALRMQHTLSLQSSMFHHPQLPPSVSECVCLNTQYTACLLNQLQKRDSCCVIGATKEAILIKRILDLLSTEAQRKRMIVAILNLFRFLFHSPADYSHSVLSVLHIRLLNFSMHSLSYLSLPLSFLQWKKTLSQLSSVINFSPSRKDSVLIRS